MIFCGVAINNVLYVLNKGGERLGFGASCVNFCKKLGVVLWVFIRVAWEDFRHNYLYLTISGGFVKQQNRCMLEQMKTSLKQFPLISDQISRPALEVVLGELEHTLDASVDGAIAEFGCYIGTSSLFIRRVLDAYGSTVSENHPFHVYDSFEGLPEKSNRDVSAAGVDFTKGQLAVSKKHFLEQFRRAHLIAPVVHKGWFDELNDDDIPSTLAFAFLDGDFYDSILTSLRLCWPRIAKGGCVVIDDYKRETLPGVERAIDDYFGGTPAHLRYAHNIAIIRKK